MCVNKEHAMNMSNQSENLSYAYIYIHIHLSHALFSLSQAEPEPEEQPAKAKATKGRKSVAAAGMKLFFGCNCSIELVNARHSSFALICEKPHKHPHALMHAQP